MRHRFAVRVVVGRGHEVFRAFGPFETMGKAVRASILGIARQGIFLIPFVLILPHCIGILGIQLAQPIADIISCLLAIPLQLQLLREMQREERRLTP